MSRRSTDRGPEIDLNAGQHTRQPDLKLCESEGFILSGLPDDLENLLALETHFGGFEFEDKRPKKRMDHELNALKAHFASPKASTDGMKHKSMFDLVIFMESDFSRLLAEKLGRFETISERQEVWLESLGERHFRQEEVLNLVTKMRVDDNYYALPAKYCASVGFVKKALDFYSNHFRSNAFGLLDGSEVPGRSRHTRNTRSKENINTNTNQTSFSTNQSFSKKSCFDFAKPRKVFNSEIPKIKNLPVEGVTLKIKDSVELEKLLIKIEERLCPILEAKEVYYRRLRERIEVDAEQRRAKATLQLHVSRLLKNSGIEEEEVVKDVVVKLFSGWKVDCSDESLEIKDEGNHLVSNCGILWAEFILYWL